MRNLLARYNVNALWHFTDRSNIDLIIEHKGLLSWTELVRRGIKVPATGGNQWSHDADGHKGVDKFIHLAFLDDHPMLFHARTRDEERLEDPVWLKISTAVLDFDGVCYTSDVSNKAGVLLLTPEEAKKQLDLDVMFTYMDWRDPSVRERRKHALKSEILVPNTIPIDLILEMKNG